MTSVRLKPFCFFFFFSPTDSKTTEGSKQSHPPSAGESTMCRARDPDPVVQA